MEGRWLWRKKTFVSMLLVCFFGVFVFSPLFYGNPFVKAAEETEEDTEEDTEETVEPTAVIVKETVDVEKGMIQTEGKTYYKVKDFLDGQDYLIGYALDGGKTDLLMVESKEKNRKEAVFTYAVSSSGGSSSSASSTLTGSGYLLTGSEQGLVFTVKSSSSKKSLWKQKSSSKKSSGVWDYQDGILSYTSGSTAYYLTYTKQGFGCSEQAEEAAKLQLYTDGAERSLCLTEQPKATRYVMEGSHYQAPEFSVQVSKEMVLDRVVWYLDGKEQEEHTLIFRAEALSEKAAGVYRISCVAEGHDAEDVYYRQSSHVVNFIVCKGIVKNSFLTFSDVHQEFEKIGGAIEEIMNTRDGCIPALVVCTGDWVNGSAADTERFKQNYLPVLDAQLGGLDTVYVSGNHEAGEGAVFANLRSDFGMFKDAEDGTGVIYDSDSLTADHSNNHNLIVYGINYSGVEIKTEDGTVCSYQDILQQTKQFLEELAKQYHGELIVMAAHTGLHTLGLQPQSVKKNGDAIDGWAGSNEYNADLSDQMVELLNQYAKEYQMDILYLFGHDHSKSEVEFLLQKEEEIISTVSYSEKTTKAQKLWFTYAHAGYLSGSIGSADDHYSLYTWGEDSIMREYGHLGEGAEGMGKTEISRLYQKKVMADEEKTDSKTSEEQTEKQFNNEILLQKSIYHKTQGKKQKFSIQAEAAGGTLRFVPDQTGVLVDEKGTVTIPKNFTGIAVLTLTASGAGYQTVQKTVQVRVKPKAVTISKIKKTNTGFVVKWKKGVGVSGYEVRYSAKETYPKKSTVVKNVTGTKLSVSDWKSGKKCYVSIRAYKTVTVAGEEKKLYSDGFSLTQ